MTTQTVFMLVLLFANLLYQVGSCCDKRENAERLEALGFGILACVVILMIGGVI